MSGTIVCGVAGPEGRAAARRAHALSDRLGLRLVLVHAVDVPRASQESLSGRQQRLGAERLLGEVGAELGGDDDVVTRVEFGEPAELLAWVAAEERAAAIVLGSRPHGLLRRGLRCRLFEALASSSPVPVLVAPPGAQARTAERALAGAAATR